MILEFGAKNYYCFKEWVSISFKLNQQCPNEISYGEEFTKILGVKGANASGKTNVLKALNFLHDFCTNSFNDKPDSEIDVSSFFYNEESTELYVEFKCDEILYKYEVELTKDAVIRETLYRTIKRENKVFERIGNELVTCVKEFDSLKIITLRDNASIISTANQYGIQDLATIYKFFNHIITNVNIFGLRGLAPDPDFISKYLYENDGYLDFVKNIIIKYDPDIKDIKILSREDESKGGVTVYYPIFSYHNKQQGKEFLTFLYQSSGTKALYLQLASYKWVLQNGGLLVLDEFDINLHPDILPDLLSIFLDKQINTMGAQLIFTTHNTSILDYLGKYRAYLVNKEDCESYAYRLDELSGDILRNDRDITPIYKSGKIGGVPKL